MINVDLIYMTNYLLLKVKDMINIEEWRTVPYLDFKHYSVSNNGDVVNNLTNKKLKPLYQKGSGYYSVTLYNKGNKLMIFIHRLVAETFIPNPNNLETVNHIDHNKLNNNVDNLEWMSRGDNAKDGNIGRKKTELTRLKISMIGKGKMKPTLHKQVVLIDSKGNIIKEFETLAESAEYIGCSTKYASNICRFDINSKYGNIRFKNNYIKN